MCMIALRPAASGNIPNAVIDAAMTRHADGFGLMWRDAKGVHATTYAPQARKPFRKALKSLDRSGVEYAAHFRFATSGPKNAEMAHPYSYEDPDPEVGTVYLMHNGVIGIEHDRTAESDTSAFVRLVLAALPSRWWTQPALVFLVNEAIDYSKFVIMTATETVNLHDKLGEWDGGLWYSSYHKPLMGKGIYSSTLGGSDGTYAAYKARTSGKGHDINTSFKTEWGEWDGETQEWTDYRTVADRLTGTTSDGTAVEFGERFCNTATGAARARLGLLDTADGGAGRIVDNVLRLRHGGHSLTAITDIHLDSDADYMDAVTCDICQTVGSVYVMDGSYYVDMDHVSGAGEDGDEEMDLLPDDGEADLPIDLTAPVTASRALVVVH